MSIKNTATHYGVISKLFHWVMATIVILMLSFSFFLGDLPDSYKGTAYMLHKSTGLLVLFLLILRIVWKLSNKLPEQPKTMPKWQVNLALGAHSSMYLLLLLMPLSGLFMSLASNRLPSFYGLFTVSIPGFPQSKTLGSVMNSSHKAFAWVLITLILFHLLGVIYHTVVKKDGVLRRMLSHG